MRVLDQYVLIEQSMTRKTSKIITDAAAQDRDKFDYSFRVLQKGNKCERDFEVGDIPIFGTHVQFNGLKVISKTDKGMITHVIVHESDMIGVDDPPNTSEKVSENPA